MHTSLKRKRVCGSRFVSTMPAVLWMILCGVLVLPVAGLSPTSQAASLSLEQIKSYPFPNELTAAATGSKIAWAFNERGSRNIWVAEGPDLRARKLTNYDGDDGQELTSVSICSDGKYVVYVRGGDHGSNLESA